LNEHQIEGFWQTHPCGETLIGQSFADYKRFFDEYDSFRYSLESHIPKCLDQVPFAGQSVLEIGLGQGADSESIIRKGAHWNGLDLTDESVNRVKLRLGIKNLPYGDIKKGSVLEIPWPENTFDIVFSHGVLHHVPDIHRAQQEISRVLKPTGQLVIMLYAKYSLNYLVSISLLRRLGLALLYIFPSGKSPLYAAHIQQAKQIGLLRYLKMKNFIHRNTDGPGNPYSKVYSRRLIRKDFGDFQITKLHKEFMHAPPLPVHGLGGAALLGWHLWAHLRPLKGAGKTVA